MAERSGAVALVAARSVSLKREGVYIGVFHKGAALCFHGCVQLRVLTGIINVAGHAFKPSDHYHPLFVTKLNSSPLLTAMDPSLNDEEFLPYLKDLRTVPVIFQPGTERPKLAQTGQYVFLSLDQEDIAQLNSLSNHPSISGNIAAVVMLKPLQNGLVSVARKLGGFDQSIGRHEVMKGFQTVLASSKEHCILSLPSSYHNIAWSLLSTTAPVCLVCGEVGMGKSTLCQFLMNYMLNRYPQVAYLECDVGQPEFTVPGVVALNIVSEPLVGPHFTHLREPELAYFYGDKSPKGNPTFYVQLVRRLCQYYRKRVLVAHPGVPLIVNTCGWTSDMGIPVFLDILRFVNPSHIVQLVNSLLSRHTHRNLLPLSLHTITTEPGILTKPTVTGTRGVDSLKKTVAVDSCNDSTSSERDSDEEGGVVPEPGKEKSERDKSLLLTAPALTRPKNKLKRLQWKVIKMHTESQRKLTERKVKMAERRKVRMRERRKKTAVEMTEGTGERDVVRKPPAVVGSSPLVKEGWERMLSYQVYTAKSIVPPDRVRDAKLMRQLQLASYLSPLLPLTGPVDLLAAVPLALPWSDVALHVIHRKVPQSVILHAVNGKYVALGKVDPNELVDHSERFPGMVKFLRSQSPPIEFIGVGLLRGIDPQRKLFYLATPEHGAALDRVNVLVTGNFDPPESLCKVPKLPNMASPYHIRGFQSALMGSFSWKE